MQKEEKTRELELVGRNIKNTEDSGKGAVGRTKTERACPFLQESLLGGQEDDR